MASLRQDKYLPDAEFQCYILLLHHTHTPLRTSLRRTYSSMSPDQAHSHARTHFSIGSKLFKLSSLQAGLVKSLKSHEEKKRKARAVINVI